MWIRCSGYAQVDPGRKLLNAQVIIADTPPFGPVAGQLWWESDRGLLWLYYVDSDSGQWVQAAGSVVVGGGGEAPAPVDAWTKAESDARYVELTGDIMSGNLTAPAFVAPGNGYFSGSTGGITLVRPGGDLAFASNGSQDPTNYYRNTSHQFQSIVGGAFASMDASGIYSAASPTNAAHVTRKDYVDTGDLLRVLKTGDTMSGSLYVGGPAAQSAINGGSIALTGQSSGLVMNKTAGTGNTGIYSSVDGVYRWILEMCNADNDWGLSRFDAAGNNLGSPFSISGATGRMQLQGPFALIGNVETITGYLSITGAITCNSSITSVGLGFTSHASGGTASYNMKDNSSNQRAAVYWDNNDGSVRAWLDTGYFWYIRQDGTFCINGNAAKPGGGAWQDVSGSPGLR